MSEVIEKWHGDFYKTFCHLDPEHEDGYALDELGAFVFDILYTEAVKKNDRSKLISFLVKPPVL